jgi:hypothetical protein
MAQDPRDQQMVAHIEWISTRAERDAQRLFSAMVGLCWPGGAGDRLEPGAVEWVRRWGPTGIAPITSACSCAAGRCRVCN